MWDIIGEEVVYVSRTMLRTAVWVYHTAVTDPYHPLSLSACEVKRFLMDLVICVYGSSALLCYNCPFLTVYLKVSENAIVSISKLKCTMVTEIHSRTHL